MQPETTALLGDIREAAQYIVDDTAGHTFESFSQDRRARQLVERNFAIIGEAVRRLSRRDPALAARITAHRKIVDLRNAVIHGYDVIDYETLWRTVQESLPVLQAEVDGLLREVGSDDADDSSGQEASR